MHDDAERIMAKSYLIYLDVCCLNRPFDDWIQDRIRLEGQTILDIFKRFYLGKWKLVNSHLLRVKSDNPVTWLMNTLLLQGNEENDTN